MVRTLIWNSTVQREAVNQMTRAINDVEPPSLQVTQDRGILLSELSNGLEGMDEGCANVRRIDAILIADHFIAVSEVEVVAGWHEKLPCFPYKDRMASKCSNYLSISPSRVGVSQGTCRGREGSGGDVRFSPWQIREWMWRDFRQGDAEASLQLFCQGLNAVHGMREVAQVLLDDGQHENSARRKNPPVTKMSDVSGAIS
jgi:hypothetical protein